MHPAVSLGTTDLLFVRQQRLYLHNDHKIHDKDKRSQESSGEFVGWHEVLADFVPVEVVSRDGSSYHDTHAERNKPESVHPITTASPKRSKAWAPVGVLLFLQRRKKNFRL